MNESIKPAVLRDVPAPSQARSLALPRHRHAVEAKPPHAPARPAPTLQSAAKPAVAAVDDARARVLADERQRAREEGLKEGLADAQSRLDEAIRQQSHQLQVHADAQRDDLRAAHAKQIERLQRTLETFERTAAQRLDDLETDAVALAYEAVCRIVGESPRNQETVSGLVRQALGQLRGGTLLRVRLHPGDLAALQGDTLMVRHPRVEWLGDATLTSGGCVVDTDHGTLDAQLDRQLARLRAVWLGTAGDTTDGTAR